MLWPLAADAPKRNPIMIDHAPTPQTSTHLEEQTPESISLSHLSHTLRRYRKVILLVLAVTMLGYAILALTAYLGAPSQRLTSLSFRLDFEGAARGEYPNKMKFSPADITATPVLLRVWQDEDLKRFIDFEQFQRSFFVLESNRDYERLLAEYQVKLAEPRLTALDRANLEREFEVKHATLSKSGYALSYVEPGNPVRIPPAMVAKVLTDILANWARNAAVEKRVLDYRIIPLSMNLLKSAAIVNDDYLISLVILRSKVNDLVANVDQMSKIPGVELVRTSATHTSLQEVSLNIKDTTRFRIDPLIARARLGGLARNWPATLRLLSSQLDYDTRELEAAQERERALRQTLDIYQQEHTFSKTAPVAATPDENAQKPGSETVVISESFIDRVVDLANRTADRQYRQDLVDQIKKASLESVPLQTTVRSDQQLVSDFKGAPGSTGSSTAEVDSIRASWNAVYGDVANTIAEINEIYTIASKQLNPVTELFTVNAAPSTRVDRSGLGIPRLFLYGLLIFLVSVPVTIAACLLHNRIREEEAIEARELEMPATD
jgi:hypothetical protein